MKVFLLTIIVLAIALNGVPGTTKNAPQRPKSLHKYWSSIAMKSSTWNGYERLDFEFEGRKCILALPSSPAQNKPWIWRTEFFDAWPAADIALLGKGFHVAYINMENMYGGPVGLKHMNLFYDYLTRERGLSKKVLLEGFSRGGLFAYNWAARNATKVAGIYADAPVCDFKSWPGGKGHGSGSPEEWDRLKNVYNLTEQEAIDYKYNPIDNLKPLADAHIPLLHVCGDSDDVVPMDENTSIVAERYRKLSGSIEVISKPGCGHHPHSLEDPTPIVNFALRYVKV